MTITSILYDPFYVYGVKFNTVGLIGYVFLFVGIAVCFYGAVAEGPEKKLEGKE